MKETSAREFDTSDVANPPYYRRYMEASGIAAHYKRALEAICQVYPHTSVAGDMMARIAYAALDREYRGLGRE